MSICPCNSGKSYEKCCKLYHEGKQLPCTAEKLMRARYSAYALHDLGFVQKTMIGPAKEQFHLEDVNKAASQMQWLRLDVVKREQKGSNLAFVEFIAFYSHLGKKGSLHERSEFHKIDDTWYYFDGTLL